ncbi:MAG: hypothetical protein JXM73_15525, partial [Anaerolineae bacterium]|nr:hypothetical protein [Anaerolineae bacterium]
SDFHLAAGNRPSQEGLARLSPTEDFFFDDAFFRFLVHCEQERRARHGYPYELVFNGDMVDFVQVVAHPAPDRVDWWFLENALPPDPCLRAPARSGTGAGQQPRDAAAGLNEPPAGPAARLWKILDDVYQDAQGRGLEEERARRSADGRAADRLAREQRKAAPVRPREVLSLARPTALEQIRDVCRGHRRFFQGLAWFLACGNRLVLMRGNHDVQWYWPEVQIALLGWLRATYDELVQEAQRPGAAHSLPVPPEDLRLPGPDGALPPLPVDEMDRRVDFDHAWYYYRDRLAYLEHGGQHEAVDTHRHFLVPVYSPKGDASGAVPAAPPPGPTLDELKTNPPQRATGWLPGLAVTPAEKEIDPAVGSLGNVFLVNNLEIELPNFERPGYNKIYLPWLLYHQPVVLLRKLLGALWRLLKSWFEWARRERRMLGYQQARREAYARLTGLSKDCARELDETPWVRRWRGPASGWFYVLLLVVSVGLPVALAFLLVFGVSEMVRGPLSPSDWLRTWLPDGIQKLLGLVDKEKLLVWDLFSGALKTLAFGFLSYWGVTLLRDWIGLGEDYLYKPSLRVAGILKKHGYDVPYLLFGHDHARNAQPVDLGAGCHKNGCTSQLRRWGFLPGRWRDRLRPWKWRWHVRFERGHAAIPTVECPTCRRRQKARVLRRQLVDRLRKQEAGWPPGYSFSCPHCGQENTGDPLIDLDFERVECEGCGRELSWQDVESSPSLWTTARGLGLTCVECDEPLPAEVLDRIRIYPHTVVYHCPACGGDRRQWLHTWHLHCPNPDCGKKPGKWDLELTEAGSALQCSCNTFYSRRPPARRWYLNTGTWMHFFATERKRLVRDVLEYPFVRLIETDAAVAFEAEWPDPEKRLMPRVELLRWNDAARRFEVCETFQGAAEP